MGEWYSIGRMVEKMLRNQSSGVPIEYCVTASRNLGHRNNNRVSKTQILNAIKVSLCENCTLSNSAANMYFMKVRYSSWASYDYN